MLRQYLWVCHTHCCPRVQGCLQVWQWNTEWWSPALCDYGTDEWLSWRAQGEQSWPGESDLKWHCRYQSHWSQIWCHCSQWQNIDTVDIIYLFYPHTKKKNRFWLVSCVGSALLASVPDVAGTAINTTKTRTWGRRSQGGITLVMMMSWCLMSSDVIWHIRDKLWPMPKHGSIKATYVRCMRV